MITNDYEPTVDKKSDKHYLSNINFAIKHTRWFLTFLGIWPYVMSKPTTIQRYLSKFLIPLCSLSMITILTHVTSHVVLRNLTRSEWLILIGPILFQANNIIKHIVLIFRAGSIKLCIRHMENDWRRIENQEDRDIMMRNVKIGHRLTTICTVCLYSGSISYHIIMPIWNGSTINEFNETVRPLVYPGLDIYFNPQFGINYEIMFGGSCITGFYLFTVIATICNLTATLVTHACAQIEIVISRLESLIDSDLSLNDSITLQNRIAFIISTHARVLKFSSNIDELLRGVCFLEIVVSTVIICLVEYYCITEWNNSDIGAIITYILLLISFSFNTFIFCHIGELLKEQCQKVGYAAYMNEWYKLPCKMRFPLSMVIIISTYPRKLTAGRMIELSIITFASIMKTSVAYLNMLRTIAQ